jgi:hypothetical protein
VAKPKTVAETEEEMKLAPLDEEAPKPATPAAVKAKATTTGQAADKPTLQKPLRSLIEEELEAARALAPPPPVHRAEGEIDPLRPPGYSGPSYGTPAWVFVAVGVGVLAVVGIVVAIISGMLG